MAKRTKYLIAAAVTVVVLAVAIGMTLAAGLLAGALVLLVALVVTLVAVRSRVAKQEKAASADWVDAIGDTTLPEEDLEGWTPSPARSGRMIADPSVFATPSSNGGAAPPRDVTTDGFEALTDEALAANDDDMSWPGDDTTDTIDWSVPSEWGKGPIADDDSDDLESTAEVDAEVIPLTSVGSDDDLADTVEDDERPVAATDETDPPDGTVLDDEPTDDVGPADDPDDERRRRHRRRAGPLRPAFADLAPIDEPAGIPELEPTASLSYATAGAATNGHRPGAIDWTGPVHTVDEHVHTADDILEASAATALPTSTDRPAPAAGSELARLLAKVEARLRDYD